LEEVSLADFTDKELIYQIGVEPNRIDIMMDVPGVRFETAWKNRRKSHYGNEPVSIISLKDLMRAKRKAARGQDLLDLRRLEAAKKGQGRA